MDARHFDALARSLTEAGTRRGLLGLLATLPVVGGLIALLDDEVGAAGRRKRRKKRHKHGRGRHRRRKKNEKKCRPESLAQTCAGNCGSVTNNCKKIVDCGSCACEPACAVCLTCEEGPNTPGTCVIDPQQQGEPCDDGNPCTTDATCSGGICGGGTTICTDPPACRTAVGATCVGGMCTYPATAAGTPCSAVPCGQCDGFGSCVGCASGRECLANGTCALPCTMSGQCTDIGCAGCVGTATGSFCRNSGPLSACGTDDDCEQGEFCVTEGGPPFTCALAC